MLERARAKVGDAVELAVADMLELPEFGEFDLVWALDDAINYLLSRGRAGTRPGGDARQPRRHRAAALRRQRAAGLPHLLRHDRGGRARRPAAGLARAGGTRRGARLDLRIAPGSLARGGVRERRGDGR